jgi:hypothetical protein
MAGAIVEYTIKQMRQREQGMSPLKPSSRSGAYDTKKMTVKLAVYQK